MKVLNFKQFFFKTSLDPLTSLYLRKNETIDYLIDILDEDNNPEVNTIKVVNNVCAALFNICLIGKKT